MEKLIQKVIEEVESANSVNKVRKAAREAYPDGKAPRGPDQKALQSAVIKRKDQLGPNKWSPSYHSWACGALTGRGCTCH